VLVDEFAHTNVPGSRHEKRWQDVVALLDDRHASDLGTWVYRVHMRGGATVERPCGSRRAAWARPDELLFQDEFGGPWVLAASDCPVCRGSGERTIPDPDTGTDLTRCDHCDGSGEILGGEG